MADHSKNILNSMRELHELLSEAVPEVQQGPSYIACSQAFDRLCLGYRNGTYTESEVQSGLEEIRRELTASELTTTPLLPQGMTSARDSVLARNYREVAQRLLEQKRGNWDTRHVELVQGAITQLSQLDTESSQELASALQKRMSDDVWLGNVELSENIHEFEREAESVQQSLISMLQERSDAWNPETMEIPETDRALALNEAVEKTVSQASRRAVVASQTGTPVRSSQAQSTPRTEEHMDAELLSYGSQRLQNAAKSLISAEYARLGDLYKSILVHSKDVLDADTVKDLSAGLERAFDSQRQDNPVELGNHILDLSNSLKGITEQSPELQRAIVSLGRMQKRAAILSEIMGSTNEAEVKSAQYLDACTLYEQKRMQFERRDQESDGADMSHLLEDNQAPIFAANQQVEKLQDNLRRIRQLTQAADEVAVYAPGAGGEYSANAYKAIQTAEQLTPMVTPIPAFQSATAKRSNRLLQNHQQLAYHPSARNDMGFAGSRYEMANQEQPLFKRVRFQKDNAEANKMLPALYRISGIKLQEHVKDTPLRKSFDGLNLSTANFELIKMLERQFNPKVNTRMSDSVTGTAASQASEEIEDPRLHAANAASEMFESTLVEEEHGTDAAALVNSGHPSEDMESSLRTEGRQLPTSVLQKLERYFDFDLSGIRIFAGPIAAAAAEAMGAHAFTLGKNIFIGANKLDYQSPEGLGLLAHEIQHTSHFDSTASVDAKEEEAEAIENLVSQNYQFALENGESKSATPIMEDPSVLNNTQQNMEEKTPAFDPDDVYDSVCDRVLEMITESFIVERIRRGD